MMDLLVRTSFAVKISFNHTKNDSTKLELIIEQFFWEFLDDFSNEL